MIKAKGLTITPLLTFKNSDKNINMLLFSKHKHSYMKSLLIAGILFASFGTMAQQGAKRSAMTDPKLGQIVLTDQAGRVLDADALEAGQLVTLRIPVSNMDHAIPLPAGTTKLKIGFGSKLQLNPSFNMNGAGLNNYFQWTSSMAGGQLQIVGDLVNDLPAYLQDISVTFKVRASVLGKSTITANFLITNHNSVTVLSDMDPSNNISFLQYTIAEKSVKPPVVKINDVARGACAINVVFGSDKEINLSRYDVEVSRDGNNYIKVSEMAATNQINYRANFNITSQIESQTILVRVRSVDMNGNYRYSVPVSVAGVCESAKLWSLNVYPNPATNVKSIMISAAEGVFKGKYKLALIDMSGQTIQTKEMPLDNVSNFRYDFGVIANGSYLIQLVNTDGSQSGTLKFEKL